MSGKPTTVNRIRSPDFSGMTSLSCPDLVVVNPVNGMVGLVEKVGEIDGRTIGRVGDAEGDTVGDAEGDTVGNPGGIGVGAAIVGPIVLIVLRKRSP